MDETPEKDIKYFKIKLDKIGILCEGDYKDIQSYKICTS